MVLDFLKLAIPSMITNFFLFFLYIINVYFAGRLNNATKLAGVGLGQTWLNVVCFSVFVGMNGA